MVWRTWCLGGDGKDRWEESEGRQRLKYLDSLGESWKNKVSRTELIRTSEDNVVDDGTAT